jgi:hypothetical protein
MTDDSGAQSASVKVVEEKDATGTVIKTYEEIKTTLGIDFVPNMYKALAVNPDYLEITWRKVQSVLIATTASPSCTDTSGAHCSLTTAQSSTYWQ